MRCLCCHLHVTESLDWKAFIMLRPQANLCQTCAKELEMLSDPRCPHCDKMDETSICTDCRNWKHHYHQQDILMWNRSIFHYNQSIKAIIANWKYGGDYIIGNIFQPYIRQAFAQIRHDLPKQTVAVPIPLSQERLVERGFNQAEMLADFIPLKKTILLERHHHEKQSKKTKRERLQSKNPFYQVKKVHNPVILVDDIYTTGTTLRHAANLLKQNGCPAVYAWTLIRG